MNKAVSIYILCLFPFLHVFGSELETQFEAANDLYSEKLYDSAIIIYENILETQFEAADIYYNLANSYFKKGAIAPAILNYERAKILSPKDKDVLFNLKLANLRAADKIEPVPQPLILKTWESLTGMNNSKEWSVLFLIFLWVILLLSIVMLLSSNIRLRRYFFFVSILILFCALTSLYFANNQYISEFKNPYGILFTQSSYVKSAPDESSKDLFIIHEGIKLEIIDVVGEWYKIKLADGKQGWIEQKDLKHIGC